MVDRTRSYAELSIDSLCSGDKNESSEPVKMRTNVKTHTSDWDLKGSYTRNKGKMVYKK